MIAWIATALLAAQPLAGMALLASDNMAEPQDVQGRFTTATEVRPILGATRRSWIAVREFNGQDLLYVTHLWSWRCGLKEIRIGVNGEAPEIWPLPECHLDTASPNAITETDGLPYRAFPLESVESVEVELLYDDLSRDTASFERATILMP
ncbi:hypothetical protein ACFORG_23345 [Lutimaribacter marinistellae]|uniref:Flagellar protein FlhE n=1 Tax=Lutimaribacter marinistellae TaxID=1820329 RepID=A0ABV7TQL9_9RHOB